jgi:hypothetical protein
MLKFFKSKYFTNRYNLLYFNELKNLFEVNSSIKPFMLSIL